MLFTEKVSDALFSIGALFWSGSKGQNKGGILKALPLQMDEEDRNHFPAFKRSLCFKCACHYVGMKMRWMHLLACV